MLRSGGLRVLLPAVQLLAAIRGGSGGRSSVAGATTTVFGATGFVGHYVVNELARLGSRVVVPFRCSEEQALPLKQMGDLGQVALLRDWSLADEDYTRAALAQSNIVINLVGSSMETRNFSFEQVHTEWPAKLAEMVAADFPHVERFIHFSDVGARPDSASRRMRSKAAGDEAVRAALPHATIFRPAPIVGEEDDFFNRLVTQLKGSIVMPLPDGGQQRVAPTNVTDVAAAVVQALKIAETAGGTYYLAGPEELTLRQLVDLILATMREDEDPTAHLPTPLARLLAAPADWAARNLPPLPGASYMGTSDWLDEISENKVLPEGGAVPGYGDLDMVPHKVTEGLALEVFRYQRVGGYQLGDTSRLADSLPSTVKRYFGMKEQ